MKETAIQVNERKIRNGIRKQAEKIQREKDKVWDRLKDTAKDKTAKRKLDSEWTVSAVPDFKIMYGMDFPN